MTDRDVCRALSESARSLLHRWFVELNPLYFFSAFCVLAGVHLVSADLYASGWFGGRLLLAGVLQLYEVLLVLGSAALYRSTGGRRPAVILAIFALAFMFDPTFQIEAVTSVGGGDALISLVWLAITAAKLRAIMWALRLEGDVLRVAILGAGGLVGFPTLLAQRLIAAEVVLLGAFWFAAVLLAWVLWRRPRIRSVEELGAWGESVLRRAVRAVVMGWAALYVYHLYQCARVYDADVTPAHVAPFFLLLPLAFRTETAAWLGAVLAIFMSTAWPETVTPTAVGAASTLVWLGWSAGPRRLLTGAIVAAFVAGWALDWQAGPVPTPNAWLVAQTAAVLLVLAWVHRLPSAGGVGALLLLGGGARHAVSLGPAGVGALLLALGFASLLVGIGMQWDRGQSPGGGSPHGGALRWAGVREPLTGPIFLMVLACSILVAAVAPSVAAKLSGGLRAAWSPPAHAAIRPVAH